MSEFFVKYLFPSAISLIVLYGVFVIFLKKETFFGLNRLFLIISILISLLLPFIEIPISLNSQNSTSILSITYENIMINGTANKAETIPILFYIYIIGVVLVSLRLIIGLCSIFYLIKKNGVTRYDGEKVIFMQNKVSHFSFFNLVFINVNILDTQEDEKEIMLHEKEHIRKLHYLDLLLSETLIIIQWFNPVAWLYRYSLKNIHEYQADMAVINNGCEISKYLNMIFKQVSGFHLSGYTNQFNYSFIKKRIIMMNKKKSSTWAKTKTLFICPVVMLLLFFFSMQSFNPVQLFGYQVEDIDGDLFGMNLEYNIKGKQINDISPKKDTTVYSKVEKIPSFPGGDDALIKFLQENLNYTEDMKDKKIQGKALVRFIVEEDGSITNIDVEKSISESVDAEVLRVIKLMPKWIPGEQKGEPARVSIAFPVIFALKN